MPHSQTSSECKHFDNVTWIGVGAGRSIFYRGICANCGILGPITVSQLGAIQAFWKQNKENSMSTSDYERGVEDALQDFIYDEISALPVTEGFNSEVLRTFLRNRRKKLLTKKVARWVNVFKIPAGELQTGGRSRGTYETKDCARLSVYPDPGTVYVGSYPIEIEIPL